MKHARFPVVLALAALLTAGCLGGDDDKPINVNTKGSLTDPTAPVAPPDTPAAPDAPADPAAQGATPAPPPNGTPAPTSPPATSKPTATTPPKPAPASTRTGAANVIQGVVRDEQGDPVPNAVITAAGYTARSNNVQRATTGADGRYRIDAVEGLYTVSGHAPIVFEGKKYQEMYLHPTDNNCGEQMSAAGITKDFVLRLTGFHECKLSPDRNNEGFYNGAAVSLIPVSMTLPGSTSVTFTLTPAGPLADGSAGKPVSFTRTVAQLSNSAGKLETTSTLHDIPLGRYTITGRAGSQELLFGPTGGARSASYTVTFAPVEMVPYGIRVNTFNVYDSAGGATTPPPTTPPATGGTCYSEYVGPIPC
jgi:hypothetical protein